jgi:SpoIID/LytB domain protein
MVAANFKKRDGLKSRTAIVALCAIVAAFIAPTEAGARRVVIIRGGGWGHGIGMSQYGAYGQALNGRSARQILEKYYTGAHVRTKKMPAMVRVGLMQTRSSIAFRSLARVNGGGAIGVKVAGSSSFLARGNTSTRWRIERSPTGGLRLYKNGALVVRDGRRVFGSTRRPLVAIFQRFKSLADVDGKSYNFAYGKLLFGTYSSSSCGSNYCLRLVLSLPMQKYIYGLGEVPSSWPGAVLRAQANAGRTYVFSKIRRLGQHLHPCDCAVYDTPIDQAYIGDAKRTGSGPYWDEWKAAVDDTRGQVIVHNGAPIQALYSSSSGGHTEHNENVWGGTPIPYLRGVPDPADDVSANPNHTWTLKMSWASFSDRLNAAFGTGRLERFRVLLPRGISGRVTVVKSADRGGVKIVGARRVARADGWAIRSVLGLKDTLFNVDVRYTTAPALTAMHSRLEEAPGWATGASYSVPRNSAPRLGRAQNFENGRMTRTAATEKVVWQWGPVLAKYDAIGREKSSLGMPVSHVWGPGSYYGASYQHGMILWSEATGTRYLTSHFVTPFRRTGGVTGPLGLPTGGREKSRKLPDSGRLQRFAGGTIYLNPRTDSAHALWGRIDARYGEIGLGASACGYPTSNMRRVETGLKARFENGVITSTAGEITVDCS